MPCAVRRGLRTNLKMEDGNAQRKFSLLSESLLIGKFPPLLLQLFYKSVSFIRIRAE
jgi:hypothetical protein